MSDERPAIFGAMVAVMDEIGAIGKNQTNTFDKYKFRGIDDVYNALHPAMVKHGVFVVPRLVRCERTLMETSKGSSMQHASVDVEYVFHASDGSSVSACVPGEGADRGDKAVNKAMSAAYKTAMFQAFCIPTDEQSDSEHDSPSLDGAKSRPRKAARTAKPNPTEKVREVFGDDVRAETKPAPNITERPAEFYFATGAEAPKEPAWAQWRADKIDRSKNEYIKGKTWEWVSEGSFGGQRYKYCRAIVAWSGASEDLLRRAENCLWDIEQAELLNRQAERGAF